MKKFIALLAIGAFYLAFIIFNMSCEISEPEDGHSSRTRSSELEELQGKKVIAGIANITIDTSGITFPIDYMSVVIDSATESAMQIRSPYNLQLNTYNYSNGLHTIYIYIYDKKLKEYALLTITGILDIDNSYPLPVNLSLGEFEGYSSPILIWTQTPSHNFTNYIVWRNLEKPYLDNYWEPIDTLNDKTDTVYTDKSLELIIDKEVYYKVSVINTVDRRGAFSENINYTIGDLGLTANVGGLIASSTKPEVFCFTGSSIHIASTETDEILQTFPVNEPIIYFLADKYGKEIYGVGSNYDKIYIYDANTYEHKRTIDIQKNGAEYIIICPGKQGELFVKTDAHTITRINTDDGSIIGSFHYPDFDLGSSIVTSADNSIIYVPAYSESSNPRILAVNVSSPVMALITSKESDYLPRLFPMADNMFLCETLDWGPLMYTIRIRDAATLEILRTIRGDEFGTYDMNMNLLISGEKMYLSQVNNIYELETSSLSLHRNWGLSLGANDLQLSYNSEYLYFVGGADHVHKIKLN